MITLPYKFVLVVSDTRGGRYRWHEFWEKKRLWPNKAADQPHVKFGMLLTGKERTYRLDIMRAFFCPDNLHWARASMRQHIRDTFSAASIKNLPQDSIIVMMWSNSLYWLSDEQVRQSMESWNGQASEPRSLWRTAASYKKWEV